MFDIDFFKEVVAAAFLIRQHNESWLGWLLAWLVRGIVFSLLFRSYVGPRALALVSDRVRVRSVSLRSIRGIFIRVGGRRLRAERLGWSYRSTGGDGGNRMLIKLQGPHLELESDSDALKPDHNQSTPSRRRTATSTLTRLAGGILSGCYALIYPLLRPLLRVAFIAGLNFCVRVIPVLTQHIDFEVDDAVCVLPSKQETRLSFKKLQLRLEVVLTELGIVHVDDIEIRSSEVKSRLRSMVAWRARFSRNLQRTWQRVLLRSRGKITLFMRLQDIKGSTI